MTGLASIYEHERGDTLHWEEDQVRRSVSRVAAKAAVLRRPCAPEPKPYVVVQPTPEAIVEFNRLSRKWKRETAILGDLASIVYHPAYQRIMALGPQVVSLILRDLQAKPAHWFWALHNLVPDGLDPAEGAGTISDATAAWLGWAREQKIL